MSCGRSTIKEGGGRVLGSTRATYRHTNQRNERGEVAECEYERRARLTGRKISKAALPQDEKRSNAKALHANTQISRRNETSIAYLVVPGALTLKISRSRK